MLKLKGIIYLPACRTKDNPKAADTFILSSAKKEYVLSSLSANPTADILSWRNSLDFAIEQSQQYEADTVVSGWLMKKGGKGHTYQNWKKRWFVLRGTCIFYYEDKDDEMEKRGWASMEKLKGFIEISRITDIDADIGAGDGIYERSKEDLVLNGSGSGVGNSEKGSQNGASSSAAPSSSYPHAFALTVNNDKSYFFASKSFDEKQNWVTALQTRIQRLASNALQMSLNVCNSEHYVRSGEMKRHVDSKRAKTNFFVLTNLNLRVYASKPDLTTLAASWGKGMIACIPLLGCSVHSSDDSDEWDLKANELALIEIQGHAYVLETLSTAERHEWAAALKAQARLLAKNVISAGETIRLTCNASDKHDHNAGYTILNIDRDQLQLKYLMLKKVVIIPFDRLKLVYVLPGFLFCLKYMQGSKAKQLKMKCGNANGIFDAVEAIFELQANLRSSADNGASSSNTSTSSPHIEMTRQKNEKILYHPSVASKEVEAHSKMQKSGRSKRMTRETLLSQRESEEEAANIAAANAPIVGSSFSDFHYMAAPSSSARLQAKEGDRKNRYSTRVDPLPSLPPAPSAAPSAHNTIHDSPRATSSSPTGPATSPSGGDIATSSSPEVPTSARGRKRTTRASVAPGYQNKDGSGYGSNGDLSASGSEHRPSSPDSLPYETSSDEDIGSNDHDGNRRRGMKGRADQMASPRLPAIPAEYSDSSSEEEYTEGQITIHDE